MKLFLSVVNHDPAFQMTNLTGQKLGFFYFLFFYMWKTKNLPGNIEQINPN